MNKHISNIRKKAGRHKTLIQNFSYLSALQVFNMLVPLITYPYLIRVLGKETYGLVVFAQAVIGYLVILVGFGFNISATKEISVHRNNKAKLGEIVSSILQIKGILFIISSAILISLIFLIPEAKEYKSLFILTLWMCLYDAIFPIWYFQGIERMKYITFITLVTRLTFLGLIFVFIHTPSDYLYIPIINGIGAVLAGILSLYIVFFQHQVKFMPQSYPILKRYFIESIPIFISNLSSKLYVSTNRVLVGSFIGLAELAYFDLAEKIVNVLKTPIIILSQTLFPRISKEMNLTLIKNTLKVSLILYFSIYICVFFTSEYIVSLLGGNDMHEAVGVIKILSITLPMIALNHILGIQLLIASGHNKAFSKIILFSTLFYFLMAFIIWIGFGFTIMNITSAVVITEITMSIGIIYSCKKYRLL